MNMISMLLRGLRPFYAVQWSPISLSRIAPMFMKAKNNLDYIICFGHLIYQIHSTFGISASCSAPLLCGLNFHSISYRRVHSLYLHLGILYSSMPLEYFMLFTAIFEA